MTPHAKQNKAVVRPEKEKLGLIELLRVWPTCVFLALSSATLAQGIGYRLQRDWDLPPATFCPPGQPQKVPVELVLANATTLSGRWGWSAAISGTDVKFLGIDLSDLWARRGAFVFSEVTTGEGNEGLVVVVDFPGGDGPTYFVPHGLEVARFDLEILPGRGIANPTIHFAEALQSRVGEVRNRVTHESTVLVPTLGTLWLDWLYPPFLGVALEDVDSALFWDRTVAGVGGASQVSIPAQSQGVQSGELFLCAVFDPPPNPSSEWRIQGFSLAMAVEGEGQVTAVTHNVMTKQRVESGGFFKTELIDPVKNNGQRGFVSGVIYTFTSGDDAEPGTRGLLKLSLEQDPDACAQQCVTQFRFQDGLRGGGQPVSNNFTIRGQGVPACNLATADFEVRLVKSLPRYVRGDANADRSVDLTDAIYILGDLFLGDASSTCRSAENANGDDRVDISDAVFLLSFLFSGAAPPPEPFPDCGLDASPNAVGLGCTEPHPACTTGG